MQPMAAATASLCVEEWLLVLDFLPVPDLGRLSAVSQKYSTWSAPATLQWSRSEFGFESYRCLTLRVPLPPEGE